MRFARLGLEVQTLALLKKLLSEEFDLPRESSVKSGSHGTGT